MSKEIVNTYKAIQQEIDKNIKAIRELVHQVEAIMEITQTITDKPTKDKLEQNVRAIHTTIESLVSQTERLFMLCVTLARKEMESSTSMV